MLALLVSYGIFRLYFILPLPQEPLAAVFIEKMVIWTMGICFVWGMGGVFFRAHSGIVLDPLLPEDSQQYVFVIEILTYQTLLFNCGFGLVCICKIFADDLVGMGEQVMLLVSIPALCAIAISAICGVDIMLVSVLLHCPTTKEQQHQSIRKWRANARFRGTRGGVYVDVRCAATYSEGYYPASSIGRRGRHPQWFRRQRRL